MIKQKLVTAIILAVVLTINSYGLFVLNETLDAFDSNYRDGSEKYSTPSLEKMVIEGAGFFLQSNSHYQMFLKEVELSGIYGIDRVVMQKAVDNAVKSMELASDTYNQLVEAANNLEYNQTILTALNHFDYEGYRDINHLNPKIFQQVERLLKAGDVMGCYQRFADAARDILLKLKSIKAFIDSGNLPEIPECWRLNQLYVETQLFGQYTTEVFMNID